MCRPGTRSACTPPSTPPTPTPKPGTYLPLIQGLTLLNAASDQPLGALKDGMTISFAALGTNALSVRADTSPTTVGSVTFQLDGTLIQTENHAPYAIAGNSNNGNDYNA